MSELINSQRGNETNRINEYCEMCLALLINCSCSISRHTTHKPSVHATNTNIHFPDLPSNSPQDFHGLSSANAVSYKDKVVRKTNPSHSRCKS
jgi:hypothetical protein